MEEEIAREKAAAEEKRRSRQQRHQQHDQPFRARRGSIDTHWQQPASSSAPAKAAREAKEAAEAKAAAEAVEVARRAEEEEAAQEAARAVAVAEAEVRQSDTTVAPSFWKRSNTKRRTTGGEGDGRVGAPAGFGGFARDHPEPRAGGGLEGGEQGHPAEHAPQPPSAHPSLVPVFFNLVRM